MTPIEFRIMRNTHIRVCEEIRAILAKNQMSLTYTDNGIWLCDDGNNIGYTGDCIQEEA